MKTTFPLIRLLPQSLERRVLSSIQRTAGLAVVMALTALMAGAPQAWGAAAPTATTLALSSASVAPGTAITLTATVKAGSASVTTGQVNFCDAAATYCTDIHLLGTAQLTAAGTASIKLIPALGSHSYMAVFAGAGSYAQSSSTAATLAVTGTYATSAAIAESGSAGSYTLTATITGPGDPSPTGLVSFLDADNANYALGAISLGKSTAVLDFPNSALFSTGVYPTFIAVGDFNGDGNPDLAVADNGNYSVTILLNNGDGTFTAAAASPATSLSPYAAAVGDFNGDGNLDLAVANAGDGTITVLLGNGDGSFTPAAPLSAGSSSSPIAIVAADFNGDGNLDLAVTNADNNTVTVLLGSGNGVFTPASASPSVGNEPLSIAAGDLNGDGIPDLVVANAGDDTLTILLGKGDGSFTAQPLLSTGSGSSPVSVAIADLNHDGKADLAVAEFGGSAVAVLLGKGDGAFTAASSPSTGASPYAITVGDFNGDGVADLATANFGDNTVTVLLGSGDGAFTAAATPAVGSYPYSLVTGVFHADGQVAPAAANFGDGTVVVLQSLVRQTAAATVANLSPVGTGTHRVYANYAGDSLHGGSLSTMLSLTAQQVPTTLTLTPSPLTGIYGQPVTLTANLSPFQAQGHNASGNVIFSNAGTTLATVTVSSATVSASVTTLPVGAESLSAVYSGDTNFLGSQANSSVAGTVISDFSFTPPSGGSQIVVPGSSAGFTFQLAPLPSASGYPGPITFSATGLPTGATATFSPNSIPAAGGAQPVTLTIQTSAASASNRSPVSPLAPVLLGLLLLPLAGVRRFARVRRNFSRLLGVALLTAALAAVAGIAGCGSNSGFFVHTQKSYSITVTASGGTVTHSAIVKLTVE